MIKISFYGKWCVLRQIIVWVNTGIDFTKLVVVATKLGLLVKFLMLIYAYDTIVVIKHNINLTAGLFWIVLTGYATVLSNAVTICKYEWFKFFYDALN